MREHGKNLPEMFNSISIVKAYNHLTGASLNHWDLERVGMLEYDEIVLAIENGDLL